MSSSTKLITVFGATGAQGGSVVRSLLTNPSTFAVRGVTRNPDSAKAKELASLGVQVVKANGFVREEVLKAFEGSWGVFLNTNADDPVFADPNKKPTEYDLAKSLNDCAAEAGVKHLVWSSNASSKIISNGEVIVETWETKWAIEQEALANKAFSTVTTCDPGWYLENFRASEFAEGFGGFPLFEDEEGYMTWKTPEWGGLNNVPWLDVADDYGDMVHGIFLDPEKWKGRKVQGVSDVTTWREMVQEFQNVSGKKARFVPLPSYESVETHGDWFLYQMKKFFEMTQKFNGLYFFEQPDPREALELKRTVWEATGRKREDAKLMTLKGWYEREYRKNPTETTKGGYA